MGRKKVRTDMPQGVRAIVIAVVRDYGRRRSAESADMWNETVDNAFLSIEPGIRRALLDDLVNRRGYDKSAASYIMSKNTYYRRRDRVLREVAINLGLIPDDR